jgi:ribosomal protein L17
MSTATITIPDMRVQLTVEQLITAARQLEYNDRRKLAKAIIAESDLDVELAQLIAELYSLPPVDDISDNDIMAEVQAVRQSHS